MLSTAKLILKRHYQFVKPIANLVYCIQSYKTESVTKHPMNKLKINVTKLLFLVAFGVLFSGCTLPFIPEKTGGLKIDSTPTASVYIDEQHVGETPFVSEKIKAGDHLIKIVPQTMPQEVYQANVNLKSNVLTVVNRNFADTFQESSVYILELEKLSKKDKAEITVISTPPNAIVRIDDQPKGFAPLLNVGVDPGQHKITLNAQGYKTLEFNGDASAGYRLLVTAELGKLYPLKPGEEQAVATPSAQLDESSPSPSPEVAEALPSATPAPTPTATPIISTATPDKPYVEILTTPTGWLRVRSEPNGLEDNEVAKVDSGTTYPYLDFNDSGWYQIEYEPGKEGWIAAQYANLVE